MSDATIYQRDIEAFGRFTAARIRELVVPLDADFKPSLRAMAARLEAATEAVLEATRKADAARAAPATPGRARRRKVDPVAVGRDVMRRLVQHAGARPGGAALTRDLLRQNTLATVLRRPAELVATMTHALEVLEQQRRRLPDHEAWTAEIERARDAIAPLAKTVRARRLERRTPTPEMQAARAAWLEVYGAAKLLVQCVLRLHGKLSLMPEIFGDLAE